jgi:hypothetical protein
MSDKNCLTLYPHSVKTWTNKPITDPRLTDVIFFSNTNIVDHTQCHPLLDPELFPDDNWPLDTSVFASEQNPLSTSLLSRVSFAAA